jgi:hypothetical protein
MDQNIPIIVCSSISDQARARECGADPGDDPLWERLIQPVDKKILLLNKTSGGLAFYNEGCGNIGW